MARRPSKKAAAKKTSVSVNFKGVQSRQLLPEDDYRLKLVEAESGESQSGNDQITWVFQVNDGGKFDGQKLWFHTPLTENSLWKLHALLTALGIEVPDDELDLDLEQMVEDELELMGVVQHETYDGTKRSKMMDFYALDEDAKDEAPAKGKAGAKGGKKAKAGLTKEAVEAMDRDELEELITEHDLDVDADDKAFKKDAKLLAAVLEALEEGDLLVEDDAGSGDDDEEEMTPAQKRAARRKAKSSDDDDDADDEKPAKKSKKAAADEDDDDDDKPAPKKGAKGKKLPKLSADEVQGMDEDELGEVIEKYGLDTDLDDYKTLRKKAAAVIDALEDGDFIEEE